MEFAFAARANPTEAFAKFMYMSDDALSSLTLVLSLFIFCSISGSGRWGLATG